MILRSAFWIGMASLCLTLGPVVGLPSLKSLQRTCESCGAADSDGWRAVVFQRLQALKTELNTAEHDSQSASERTSP
jgi:hypothetical protein